jgi:hypothetical protein
MKSNHKRQSDEALFADQSNFDAFAVRENAQDGDQSTLAEVCRLQDVARLMQKLVGLQTYKFQLGKQNFEFSGGQSKQDLVSDLASVAF